MAKKDKTNKKILLRKYCPRECQRIYLDENVPVQEEHPAGTSSEEKIDEKEMSEEIVSEAC
jgi:hypothetical protein